MEILSPSQRWAVGKEKSGQEGMYSNWFFFLQLLAPSIFVNHTTNDSSTSSHAGESRTLDCHSKEILSCQASSGWKSKCHGQRSQWGHLPPPPHSPTSIKGNGGGWGNGRRKWNHAGTPGKDKCWWQQGWWVCCGHYLLMRLPRRLPLMSWWLWEQAFLHQ